MIMSSTGTSRSMEHARGAGDPTVLGLVGPIAAFWLFYLVTAFFTSIVRRSRR